VTKFGFKIRTRDGTVVSNLVFAARDRAEAERKVTQIYQRCEIFDCRELQHMATKVGVNPGRAVTSVNQYRAAEFQVMDAKTLSLQVPLSLRISADKATE
jgi:hypothetical protein